MIIILGAMTGQSGVSHTKVPCMLSGVEETVSHSIPGERDLTRTE